nr:serine/arginine repetitive matrix protein 2-like [Ipomoea batatas]
MSDSDSQNVSAQDYDDAVEATPTDASSANSTGTADEVGSHDGWVGEDGPRRGKSPRVVVARYPPATREALLAELPPGLRLQGPFVKISAEAYEYWVFRSPESVAAADLEPPDYSQSEKYVPKKMSGSSSAVPTTEPAKQGMVLERSFAPASTGPKKPCPKVTLGGSKAPLPVEAPTAQGAAPTVPVGSTGTTPAVDLQVARPTTRCGKEKSTDQEVEEIPPLKRQKRPAARGSTPVLDALREGGEHTVSFIDRVRAVIPTREAIRDLETDQVGEMIAQSVLWVSPPEPLTFYSPFKSNCLSSFLSSQLSHMMNDLFCRAKAAENVVRKDVAPLKESLAAKDKELTEKVQALEARIASAEHEVEAAKRETAEMNEKMSSYANLSGFLCRDPREAEAFFRAFIHKEVGEELAWRYGEWAYAKGRYEMQQAVREALEESLDEKDFAAVMGVMPDPAPAPGPMPYADPAPGDEAPAPAKP